MAAGRFADQAHDFVETVAVGGFIRGFVKANLKDEARIGGLWG